MISAGRDDLAAFLSSPVITAHSISRVFDYFNCEGLARVDFFLTKDDEIIVNEINTMPGFTSISMFPRMWEASGVKYDELVDYLIQEALNRPIGLH